jgi:FkbM family methyltransferase
LNAVDPVLLRLAAEIVRPRTVVWDIGANLGLFSLAAAQMAGPDGHIVAIEPDAQIAGLLRRSAAANDNSAEISVFPAAVTDKPGVARFHVARRNRSTSYVDGFGTTQTGGVRMTTLVPTVTLDWLADHFPVPNVIKIDVEGAEVPVLSGGRRVLSTRPTIICEVSAENAASVAGTLREFGYDIFDGDQERAKRIPLSTAPPNTLATGPAPGSKA